MSKCNVWIELDATDARYHSGATVTGHVHVETTKEVRCDGLQVSLRYATHGSGNVDTSDLVSNTLFVGQWTEGQYRYPFKLRIPDTAATFHGHHINVDYTVHATADIPWALDPKGSETILIAPAPAAKLKALPHDLPPSLVGPSTTNSSPLPIVPIVGVALFGLYFVTKFGGEAMSRNIFDVGFYVVLGLIVLLFMYRSLKRHIAMMRIGTVDARLNETEDGLRCIVGLKERAGRPINHLTAKLLVQEVAFRGSGTHKRIYQNDFFEKKHRLHSVGAGPTPQYEVDIPIPQDLPPSFKKGGNWIQWSVIIEIDIPHWPDYAQTFPLKAFRSKTGGSLAPHPSANRPSSPGSPSSMGSTQNSKLSMVNLALRHARGESPFE